MTLMWWPLIFTFLLKIYLYGGSGMFVDCLVFLGDKQVILPYDIGEDIICDSKDDEIYPVDSSIFFVGKKYGEIWWSTNGFVEIRDTKPLSHSFRCTLSNLTHPLYHDKRLIAPCCDDLKTKVSSVGERIFHRSSSKKYDIILSTDYDDISKFINQYFFYPMNPAFSISVDWFFVLTFDRVSLIHTHHPQSFQLILATDESKMMTFAIFQYPSDGLAGEPNVVGIVDGTNQQVVIKEHISESKVYPQNVNLGSNVNIRGTYIFRLDGHLLKFKEPITCNDDFDFQTCNRPHGICNITSFQCICNIDILERSTIIQESNQEEDQNSEDQKTSYFGPECKDTISCFGVSEADHKHVCSGIGICVSLNNCSCPDQVSGQTCEVFQCFGMDRASPLVCSGMGECVNHDVCECLNETFGGPLCNLTACYGKCRDQDDGNEIPSNINDVFINDTLPLLHINDNFDDLFSLDPKFWEDEQILLSLRQRTIRAYGSGCGGDFGPYLFFSGNESRSITSKIIQKGKVKIRFWFTLGRKDEIFYHECKSLVFETKPINDTFQVYIQLIKKSENSEIVLKEKSIGWDKNEIFDPSKIFGKPRLVNWEVSVEEEFRMKVVQSLPPDKDWDGLGGEWGMDSLILTVLPSEDIPCSARGICLTDGECVCEEDIETGQLVYEGKECGIPICFGISATDTKNVCSGKGKCIGADICDCGTDPNAFGPDCSGPGWSCYGLPSVSSLVCSGKGKCQVNVIPERNNFCCCEFGYYGHECQSEKMSDFVFEEQCFGETSDFRLWRAINGGEFTSGNQKCGSISGQSLYFSGSPTRALTSSWQAQGGTDFELSFWLVQGRGTIGCTYSDLSDHTLEIILEQDYKSEETEERYLEDHAVSMKTLRILDLEEYRSWRFIQIPFKVESNSTSFRLTLRQNHFSLFSDQWAVDLLRLDPSPLNAKKQNDWWLFILFGIFTLAIVIVGMVICTVIIYAVYHRVKGIVKDYIDKKLQNAFLSEEMFLELEDSSDEDDDKQWSVEGSTTTEATRSDYSEMSASDITVQKNDEKKSNENENDESDQILIGDDDDVKELKYRPRLASSEMISRENGNLSSDLDTHDIVEEENEENEEEIVMDDEEKEEEGNVREIELRDLSKGSGDVKNVEKEKDNVI